MYSDADSVCLLLTNTNRRICSVTCRHTHAHIHKHTRRHHTHTQTCANFKTEGQCHPRYGSVLYGWDAGNAVRCSFLFKADPSTSVWMLSSRTSSLAPLPLPLQCLPTCLFPSSALISLETIVVGCHTSLSRLFRWARNYCTFLHTKLVLRLLHHESAELGCFGQCLLRLIVFVPKIRGSGAEIWWGMKRWREMRRDTVAKQRTL